MKKLVVGVLFANVLFGFDTFVDGLSLPSKQIPVARTRYEIAPYAGISYYTGSTKKERGSISGLYFANIEVGYKTEIDVKYQNITLQNSSSINQEDFSLLINFLDYYNYLYKFGLHYIASQDNISDNGNIFIGGFLTNYDYYQYGSFLYYSTYRDSNKGPSFVQLSPQIGISFGNCCRGISKFYAQFKIDYIKSLTNVKVNNLDSSYLSSEILLTAYNADLTTTMTFWFGKRSFAVSDFGLVVDNLQQNEKGGVKIAQSYQINRFSLISGAYIYTNFDENGKSSLHTLMFNYSYKF